MPKTKTVSRASSEQKLEVILPGDAAEVAEGIKRALSPYAEIEIKAPNPEGGRRNLEAQVITVILWAIHQAPSVDVHEVVKGAPGYAAMCLALIKFLEDHPGLRRVYIKPAGRRKRKVGNAGWTDFIEWNDPAISDSTQQQSGQKQSGQSHPQ